ncbi:hypothetical protein BGZ97_005875, partial [Linnemannia gamsii]
MKFAKYLQDEVVPEWRKAYINYKQGKKHLKVIERVLDQLDFEAAQALQAQEAHEVPHDTLSPLPTPVAEVDEDRSALGGRTLNGQEDDDEEAARTVRPKKEIDGLRQSLGSTALQFGQTARSQSSQLLKNLSRR